MSNNRGNSSFLTINHKVCSRFSPNEKQNSYDFSPVCILICVFRTPDRLKLFPVTPLILIAERPSKNQNVHLGKLCQCVSTCHFRSGVQTHKIVIDFSFFFFQAHLQEGAKIFHRAWCQLHSAPPVSANSAMRCRNRRLHWHKVMYLHYSNGANKRG